MGLATLDTDVSLGVPGNVVEDFDLEIAAGRRQPKDRRAVGREVVSGGPSWWVGKSRDELSAEADARAHDMSRTAVGRTVAGRVNTP